MGVPGEELTKLNSWLVAPVRVRAVLTVWMPEAGKVIVRAVVSSRSRVLKVLLPVMVRFPPPVGICCKVP